MRWVRTNRGFGFWCALLAIAIQIIASFGHAHRMGGFGGSPAQAAAAIHGQSTLEARDPAPKPIGWPFEYCAICVVVNMSASMMPARAPASDTPAAVSKVGSSPHTEAPPPTWAYLFFQARAPPPA
jgi:hypothetical protein